VKADREEEEEAQEEVVVSISSSPGYTPRMSTSPGYTPRIQTSVMCIQEEQEDAQTPPQLGILSQHKKNLEPHSPTRRPVTKPVTNPQLSHASNGVESHEFSSEIARESAQEPTAMSGVNKAVSEEQGQAVFLDQTQATISEHQDPPPLDAECGVFEERESLCLLDRYQCVCVCVCARARVSMYVYVQIPINTLGASGLRGA